jgi:hypothetical protein
MNYELATQFIRAHGTPLELARLSVLEGGTASTEVLVEFQASQRKDGGFPPFWAPDYSSLDAACFRLAQAQQLGIPMEAPVVAAVMRFLAGRQKADGSWEEEASNAAKAPPWATPGDLAATLYLTANCASWLAASAEVVSAPKRAAAFLSEHQEPSGRLPSFLHTHWLAAATWLRLGMELPAEFALEYLGSRFDDLSASHQAWLVTSLLTAGLDRYHPLISRSLAKLEVLHQPDGRWQSDDGPNFDVNTTLEALHAFRLCGVY